MWYYQLENEISTPSWNHFVELIHTRFGPPLRSNPLGELTVLKRPSTMADYCEQFLTLLYHAGLLTEHQQINIFTTGLREAVQIDVELQEPMTLDKAMSLARAYERRAHSVAQTGSRPRWHT